MACTNEETPLPTLQPTLAPLASSVPDTAIFPTPESTGEAGSVGIPASSTAEADPALQEIDQAICAEALETQAELESLQEQGQDVAELATAAAELVGEMSQCASFYTPTPLP